MGILKSEPASLKLEAARNRVLAWRRTRSSIGPMPAELWKEAIELVGQFGLAPVARILGVDYAQLKKRASASAPPAPAADLKVPGLSESTGGIGDGERHFVELGGGQFFNGPAASEVVVEVSNPAGARLTLRVPAQGVDISGLVQAFCGYGGR